ncbi:MAG TPA: O-antigen ligase family protein [Solirubrobacter sp.]|nr:O-antigen ligase family protein [Solirubrobacter sp.]
MATAWLGFHAGGFFPGQVGIVATAFAILLVARVTLARRPFEGWSPLLALASGALAGFAVWILASALWSHAPARALSEFDRALLYALVLVLLGSAAARIGDLSMLVRWTTAALAAIALAGLLTRLLPGTFPISGGYLPERLSFPLTYWNAMGIACALGALFVVHLTSSGREHVAVRIVAAALLAPIAVTLYLTFSRGAIWVLPIGLVLYVLLAQPRGLLTGLVAAGVPAAIATKVAYANDLLARASYDSSPAAAAQGRHVALVVLACALGAAALRAILLLLDARIERVPVSRRARAALTATLIVALFAGALPAGAPRRIADARETFSRGQSMAYNQDLRTRLTSAVDNGRIAHWRVALDAWRASPLHGTGAGTYRLLWDQHRPVVFKVNDAHSLYLETLAELGVVGLVLLLTALGTIFGGAIARLGGAERHAHGAFLAAGAMLAVHAGVDWDWEMPALFVWLFGGGGVVLAARSGRIGDLGRVPRLVAALAVLVLAITPVLFAYSQPPLERAVTAFLQRDCRTAIDQALTATERFGTRPEPWEVLGYCDARFGDYALARRAMDAARERDPNNWQLAYGQAIVYGVSGLDARPFAAEALRLNPKDETARALVRDLAAAKTEARRRKVAVQAPIPYE